MLYNKIFNIVSFQLENSAYRFYQHICCFNNLFGYFPLFLKKTIEILKSLEIRTMISGSQNRHQTPVHLPGRRLRVQAIIDFDSVHSVQVTRRPRQAPKVESLLEDVLRAGRLRNITRSSPTSTTTNNLHQYYRYHFRRHHQLRLFPQH